MSAPRRRVRRRHQRVRGDFGTQAYPGDPEEAVSAWAATDCDNRVAGPNQGRLIVCGDGRWEQIAIVPFETDAAARYRRQEKSGSG